MRGDIYRLRPRASGHQQAGPRYAVVLQSDHLPLSTIIVAPTSTSAPPQPFRPEIDMNGSSTRVLVEQLTAVDTDRLGEFAGRLDAHEMDAVVTAVHDVLDLL